jgi:hypothetical protein
MKALLNWNDLTSWTTMENMLLQFSLWLLPGNPKSTVRSILEHEQNDYQDRYYCFFTSVVGKLLKIARYISKQSFLNHIDHGFEIFYGFSTYSYKKTLNSLENEVI